MTTVEFQVAGHSSDRAMWRVSFVPSNIVFVESSTRESSKLRTVNGDVFEVEDCFDAVVRAINAALTSNSR